MSSQPSPTTRALKISSSALAIIVSLQAIHPGQANAASGQALSVFQEALNNVSRQYPGMAGEFRAVATPMQSALQGGALPGTSFAGSQAAGSAVAASAGGGGISMGTLALGGLGALAVGGGVVAAASAGGGGGDGDSDSGSSSSSSTGSSTASTSSTTGSTDTGDTGSGTDTGDTGSGTEVVIDAPGDPIDPVVFETPEFRGNPAYEQINLQEAYARSRYDLGPQRTVVVAVADTGIDTDAAEFNGKLVEGYSAFSDDLLEYASGMPAGHDFDAAILVDENGNIGYEKDGETYYYLGDAGHGTMVAGIIGGSKSDAAGNTETHGVAYNAKLMPISIINTDPDYYGGGATPADEPIPDGVVDYFRDDDGDIQIALPYSDPNPVGGMVNHVLQYNSANPNAKVHVLNGSYGFVPEGGKLEINQDYYDYLAQYKQLTDNGVALVFAAGNEGRDNPGFPALLPYIRPENHGNNDLYEFTGTNADLSSMETHLVAVTSVDSNNNLSSFANKCGKAAAWCIAAPGENHVGITNIDDDGRNLTYEELKVLEDPDYYSGPGVSGTSFAAPMVSGSIALLLEMFPNLSSEQAIQILFDTAYKPAGYDPNEIGHGVLDLAEAVSPQGTITLKSSAGTHVPLASSNVAAGGAIGDSLNTAMLNMKVASFDKYGRAFEIDLSGFAAEAKDRFNLDLAWQRFAKSEDDRPKLSIGAFNVQMNMGQVEEGEGPERHKRPVMQDARVDLQASEDLSVTMTWDRRAASMFGLRAEDESAERTLIQQDAFASPFAGFADEGVGTRVSLKSGENSKTRFGVFVGDDDEDRTNASVGVLESWIDMGSGVSLSLQGGAMVEKNTLLGTQGEGAFAFANGARTAFAGVGVSADLGSNVALRADVHQGMTWGKGASGSLYSNIGTIRSESFSAGLTAKDLGTKGGNFNLTVHQPLRVATGSATLHLERGYDNSGNALSSDVKVPLKPTGREIGIEAGYSMPLTGEGVVSAGALLRLQPGHQADAEPEAALMLKAAQPF